MVEHSSWPALPLAAWAETCDTLHLWTQIVGKVRLACTPLINHWWNVTFFVNSLGLVAPSNRAGRNTFDVLFDLSNHQLRITTSDGRTGGFDLVPMRVADFYHRFMEQLRELDINVHIWTMPSEIGNAIPFDQDRVHAQYDRDYVSRFHQVLVRSARAMSDFRARFVGKASPVHFFWGSFDVAVTRFSGRTAPPPTGVTPNVASWVMAEAYSHEVSSCGFWPGNGGYGRAAFYVYAYPEPAGYGGTTLRTPEAFYDQSLGQFILAYDAVSQAPDPEAKLFGFLQETYEAVAELGQWDRKALERPTQ
jgi:hypothetical protein